MTSKKNYWKKGRGKLGILQPLLGRWEHKGDSPMGKLKCTREFTQVLDGKFFQLKVKWDFGKNAYEELALYGIKDGEPCFWSFTSDGKHSEGYVADGTDVHPEAICFHANMPAGLARMIYWPGENGEMHWAVESKNKKGWNRFTEHHYTRIENQ